MCGPIQVTSTSTSCFVGQANYWSLQSCISLPPDAPWSTVNLLLRFHFIHNFVHFGLHIRADSMFAPSQADSRLAPSQWETPLQSNAVSHWLGVNLESAPTCNALSLAHWRKPRISPVMPAAEYFENDFILIVSCSWRNYIIFLLMFIAEKVLLLLVIFLTDNCIRTGSRSIQKS